MPRGPNEEKRPADAVGCAVLKSVTGPRNVEKPPPIIDGGSKTLPRLVAVSMAFILLCALVACGGLVVDDFNIQHRISGETLRIWLETDLPDDRSVYSTVQRYFQVEGESEPRPMPLWDGWFDVATLRDGVTLHLTDEARQYEEAVRRRLDSPLNADWPSVIMMPRHYVRAHYNQDEKMTGRAAQEMVNSLGELLYYQLKDRNEFTWGVREKMDRAD